MASVRQFYPRSLLRLILLGNVLVALPLLVAIVYVFFDIGELTDRSEMLTREASLAVRHGHELLEELSATGTHPAAVRGARRPSLLDDYRRGAQGLAQPSAANMRRFRCWQSFASGLLAILDSGDGRLCRVSDGTQEESTICSPTLVELNATLRQIDRRSRRYRRSGDRVRFAPGRRLACSALLLAHGPGAGGGPAAGCFRQAAAGSRALGFRECGSGTGRRQAGQTRSA